MVRTPILVILLFFFLCAFLGLRPFVTSVLQAQDVAVMGISVFDSGVQVFLALGVIFLEFAIIFFALLDRIGDTIKAVLKPLVSLLPLAAFVASIQRTFTPLFLSILPESMALRFGGAELAASAGVANAGIASNEGYVAAAISDGSFTTNVLLTVVTMALFALVSYATTQRKDIATEIRQLRAENARYRRLLQ